MLRSIEGVYRNGRIELSETPVSLSDETRVIVTFLESSDVDLRSHGIDEKRAADLRARYATFTDDWDNPEMSVYDHYDSARAKL
jgi:hypothetical protein